MRRSYISLAIALVSLAVALGRGPVAQNSQALIDVASPAYVYLDAICLELGRAVPNRARPWSVAELRSELGRLDPTSLSAAGRRAWEYLVDMTDIQSPDSGLRFGAGLTLNPEGFARVSLGGNAYDDDNPYGWLHGYEERKSLIEIPLEFMIGEGFYAVSVLAGKEEHATVSEATNYSNLIFDDPNARIDLYFPFKAYAVAGGESWSLRFGRDSLSWGNGDTGNMLLSDWSDFYDYIGLSLFGDPIKFSSVYSVFDPFDPKTLGRRYYAAFMGHRLDFRLFDRMTVSINESVTFGGDYYSDLIRDLNPFMIFHNWTIPDRTNSLMSLEIDYVPWRWFELYGQAAMDEFATQYEEDRDGGGGPPVFGLLTGAKGVWPLGPGYLSGGLEWATTSPWLYNRRGPPYYYNVRRYWSLTNDTYEYVVKPIGYRYGPDAIVWNARASWDCPDGPGFSLTTTWLIKGEKTISDDWSPAEGDTAPSGTTPEKMLAIELIVNWPFFAWLEASGGFAFVSRRNIGNSLGAWSDDIELFAKISISL